MSAFVQWTQRSLLTRWMWRFWQHEETGNVTLLPLWKSPGRRWYRCKWKE